MIRPDLPPDMSRWRVLWHWLRNAFDRYLKAKWGARCTVCRGMSHGKTVIRGFCAYCRKAWPEWYATNGWKHPTQLSIWRGAPDECLDCGFERGHASDCHL